MALLGAGQSLQRRTMTDMTERRKVFYFKYSLFKYRLSHTSRVTLGKRIKTRTNDTRMMMMMIIIVLVRTAFYGNHSGNIMRLGCEVLVKKQFGV